MKHLRLVSSNDKREFVISTRHLIGYEVDPSDQELTLFTESSRIAVCSPTHDNWDNWDEFIKKYFKT